MRGAARYAMPAARARDQIHSPENSFHLFDGRQLRLIQRRKALHKACVLPHLLHIAHAGQHHGHTGKA